MSYNKDLSIIAQNAGTTAANLLASFTGGNGAEFDLEGYLSLFEEVRERVFSGTLKLAGDNEPVSVADVVQAFSGATVTDSSGKGGFVFKAGKHQGKTLAQVDAEPGKNGRDVGRDYLTWYAEKGNDDATVRAVRAYLAAA